MFWRVIISALIFLCICLPVIFISFPVVAYLLHTKWDGKTTIFGNRKYGFAVDHPAYPTDGNIWREFNWLTLRNPVNNLLTEYLAVPRRSYGLQGDAGIGDKLRGGFYRITMGWAWEFYWIKPYTFFGPRCIRARIGWKIYGGAAYDGRAAFVFVLNPWKRYLGV